ncbi:MAG: glycosyltransferase family 1 protein, partial [Myxococcales bacterium]
HETPGRRGPGRTRQSSVGHSRRFIIDGSMAKGGGGFTYLVNIVPELARQAPNDLFKVLCADKRVSEALSAEKNVEIEYLGSLGLKDRLRFTYTRAANLARDWKADVYFSAGEMVPINADCPTIAAFRNRQIFTLGEGETLTFIQRLRLLALNALARLTASSVERVMFVSKDSADWIGDSIGLPESKRTVIHHGIDPEPWRKPRTPGDLHDRPYILSVSSIYPYKNYVRLIEAYVELANRQPDVPDLVIIGDNQDEAANTAMHAARDAAGEHAEAIHLLGEVPYADIHTYYRNASLFVFPSYLETFGHPLLEAMAADVPLVAADIPVFREIAADAAFYANPFSTASLASSMEDALFIPGAGKTLVKRGRERLKHFSWSRSASTLLATFDSVLREDEDQHEDVAKVHVLALSEDAKIRTQHIAARVPIYS